MILTLSGANCMILPGVYQYLFAWAELPSGPKLIYLIESIHASYLMQRIYQQQFKEETPCQWWKLVCWDDICLDLFYFALNFFAFVCWFCLLLLFVSLLSLLISLLCQFHFLAILNQQHSSCRDSQWRCSCVVQPPFLELGDFTVLCFLTIEGWLFFLYISVYLLCLML